MHHAKNHQAQVVVHREGQIFKDSVGRLLVHKDHVTYVCLFFDASTKGTLTFHLVTERGMHPVRVEYLFSPSSGVCTTSWCGSAPVCFNAYEHCSCTKIENITCRLEFARVTELPNYEPTFKWIRDTHNFDCIKGCKNIPGYAPGQVFSNSFNKRVQHTPK